MFPKRYSNIVFYLLGLSIVRIDPKYQLLESSLELFEKPEVVTVTLMLLTGFALTFVSLLFL
jgi:hypothetical protein